MNDSVHKAQKQKCTGDQAQFQGDGGQVDSDATAGLGDVAGLLSVYHNKKQVQLSSVTQLCPTLCDPMNCSTPGLPVHHQLPEFTQTQVH